MPAAVSQWKEYRYADQQGFIIAFVRIDYGTHVL
jgi:hypothetical protein